MKKLFLSILVIMMLLLPVFVKGEETLPEVTEAEDSVIEEMTEVISDEEETIEESSEILSYPENSIAEEIISVISDEEEEKESSEIILEAENSNISDIPEDEYQEEIEEAEKTELSVVLFSPEETNPLPDDAAELVEEEIVMKTYNAPKNGVLKESGVYYWYKNGSIDTSRTGIYKINKLYDREQVVTGGSIRYDATNILSHKKAGIYLGDYEYVGKSLYLLSSRGKTQESYYFKQGKLQSDYTGFVGNKYVIKGVWIEEYSGLSGNTLVRNGKKSTYTGIIGVGNAFYYLKNGTVQKNTTGIVDYENGSYYVVNGKVDWSRTGIVKKGTEEYFVDEGVWSKNYDGLSEDSKNAKYIAKGKVNKQYTGVTGYKDSGKKYIVKKGVIQTKTGLYELNGKYYYIGSNAYLLSGKRVVKGKFDVQVLLEEYPNKKSLAKMDSETILKIQKRLNVLGYPCTEDGVYTEELQDLILKLQKDYNLEYDEGRIWKDTWNVLFITNTIANSREMIFKEDTFEAMTIYEEIVERAYSEVGYETKPGYSKFGEWYGMKSSSWCNMFVSWAAEQAGVINRLVSTGHYTETTKKWYMRQDAFETIESGYIPKPGDLIYYWETTASKYRTVTHVGIVAYCDGKTLVTVEGNKFKYWPDPDIRIVGEFTWKFQKEQHHREYNIVGFGNVRKVAKSIGLNDYLFA